MPVARNYMSHWLGGRLRTMAPVLSKCSMVKAAAQILLGAKNLPVRVFVDPDLNVLLQANTNAGDKLKQVAFDMAVKRHLGSTLYRERLNEYRATKYLEEESEIFSERDLVAHFKGSSREMQKYILDALRNSITSDPENR